MNIGTLSVSVVANIDKFASGLSKGSTMLRTFTRALTPLRAAVTGFGAAMVSSFSVASIKRVADEIDTLAKASDRLNLSTQNLIGLGHAADLSGVSLESFTKAMTHLHKNIGGKESSTALARLGLDPRELAKMQADQMFLKVADAISKMGDASSQTAVSMELFGRAGADLLPLIEEGPAKLASMTKEAAALGMTFSRFDASKVEEMNDAVTRLTGAWKGLVQELTINVAPALADIADRVTFLITMMRGTNPMQQFKKNLQNPLGRLEGLANNAPKTPTATPSASGGINAQTEWFKFGLKMRAQMFGMQAGNVLGQLLTHSTPGGLANLGAKGLGGLLSMVPKATGQRPDFALTQSGSAESYRQQASIRRENEAMKLAKETHKEEKKQTNFLGQILDKITPLVPANIF